MPRSDAGQRHAHLALLVRREEVDDAVDRVGRADRVQRREHEVAGLRRGQRGLHRLDVAHLADEDHVGVLAQHALQRGSGSRLVSVPTSRWLTIDALSACRISIGSSIVTMCLCWVSLM